MRPVRVLRPFIPLAMLALFLAPPARAGNNYTFFIGGRAAGMAGAYTAMSDEPSVAWYNPAGLGFNMRSSLDASANAFFLEIVQMPKFFTTILPSTGTHVNGFSTTTFQVVPTSLTYVMRLGGKGPPRQGGTEAKAPVPPVQHNVAFSIFVPQAVRFQKTIMLDTTESVNGVDMDYHQKLHVQAEMLRYFIGPSWGMRIGDRLSVGASLFVTYATAINRGSFTLGFAPKTGNPIFGLMNTDGDGTEIGLATQAGVQFRPIAGLHLGLTVRPPVVRLWRQTTATATEAGANPYESTSNFADWSDKKSEMHFDMASPLSVSAGIAWSRPGFLSVALDGDFMTPWEDEDSSIETKWTFNGRLGCEVWVAPRWTIAAGAFTDFAPERKMKEMGDRRLDFFGGTVAVSYVTPYKVVESEKTDQITFGSTIGLKYAYGTGKVMGGRLDMTAEGENWQQVSVPAHMHDISLILASSLVF